EEGDPPEAPQEPAALLLRLGVADDVHDSRPLRSARAEGPPDGGLERDEAVVEVVEGVQVRLVGRRDGGLRIEELEQPRRPERVAALLELELLLRDRPVALLGLEDPVRRLE